MTSGRPMLKEVCRGVESYCSASDRPGWARRGGGIRLFALRVLVERAQEGCEREEFLDFECDP